MYMYVCTCALTRVLLVYCSMYVLDICMWSVMTHHVRQMMSMIHLVRPALQLHNVGTCVYTSTLCIIMCVLYGYTPFETVTVQCGSLEPPITLPTNVYIVAGCGNGCQASTVRPRMYHRRAIAPSARKFAAIRRLPNAARAVLVWSRQPGLAACRQTGRAYYFKNLLYISLLILVYHQLHVFNPCNTTDTTTLTTLHPPK